MKTHKAEIRLGECNTLRNFLLENEVKMRRETIRKSQKSHKEKKKAWRAIISHMLKGREKRMYECKEGRERKRSFRRELPVNCMSTGDSIMPVLLEIFN